VQVYKGVLRETGEEVAIKVQRPQVEPIIARDLYIFRAVAAVLNPLARRRLGCSATLIVDEFGEKLMEELDYGLEAQNIQDFYNNFRGDPLVQIPWVRRDLTGKTCIIMEWINGIRCTDPAAIHASPNIDVQEFIQTGVVSGLRQLLEFGLFHGDPHPGNIFALEDGRIAYVDFGNVAQISQYNKQVLCCVWMTCFLCAITVLASRISVLSAVHQIIDLIAEVVAEGKQIAKAVSQVK
jgi:predicted unusual protein kinase regulating ubiquinone biosynthesis (AarF/ABC1/UbiB family)